MDNRINYTLTLNDMLSGKLSGINSATGALNSSMSGLSKIMGTLGVGFGIFKGLEFVKSGLEKVEELHQATAQVQAALTSTNSAAGLSMKQLEESAKSLASNSKFGRADIFGMQSLLLTFTSVKDKIFNEAQPAIMDLATRMGGDLKGASIQVGKALNDPIQGMTALKRVGVSFSESQKYTIKQMQATGDLAGAQKIILRELATEFGGSAKAAYDANPLIRFNKMMGAFQIAVGEGALAVLKSLVPALETLAQMFKDAGSFIGKTIDFVKEFRKEIMSLVVGAGIGLVSSGIFTMITALKALDFQLLITKGIVELVSGVMFVFENIVTFGIPILIATIAGGLYYLYGKFAEVRSIIFGVWEWIKQIGSNIAEFFRAIGDMMHGNFVSATLRLKNLFSGSGETAGKAYSKGFKNGMTDFAHEKVLKGAKDTVEKINEMKEKGMVSDKAYNNSIANLQSNLSKKVKSGLITEDEKKETLAGLYKNKKGLGGIGGAPTNLIAPPKKDSTKGVSGSKVVTINVSIGNLINDFQIKTTNIQESSTAIKDKVLQALTSAVNDSQLVAGQ